MFYVQITKKEFGYICGLSRYYVRELLKREEPMLEQFNYTRFKKLLDGQVWAYLVNKYNLHISNKRYGEVLMSIKHKLPYVIPSLR